MKELWDELDQALRELRLEHRSVAAPSCLERKLRSAARTHRSARRVVYWIPALAAAAVIAVLLLRISPPPSTVPVLGTPRAMIAQNGDRPKLAASQPVAIARKSRRHRVNAVAPQRMSNFMSLPASEFLPPPGATSILSVQLRKGDLRQYGLDVPPPVVAERIRVDFVVGEDGLARALRFVP